MFKTRKYNKNTGKVELWAYDWDRRNGRTQKRYLNKIEDDIDSGYASGDDLQPGSAVCWSFEGTMGNIAVNSAAILGRFDAESGTDAVLPCEIIKAGKFRHGAPRWYCRTHMVYWGTNADIEAQNSRSDEEGEIVCSNSTLKFSYVKNPLTIDLNEFSEVGIWCSLPPALSSRKIEKRDAKIHLHVRCAKSGEKLIDRDYDAIICKNPSTDLFEAPEITQIQITPPAVLAFLTASISELKDHLGCVSCNKCHFPHLDLGRFASEPHTKHFCANCGGDSTWTKPGIISNPLKKLHDRYKSADSYIDATKKINLDKYRDGFEYIVWSSTPAIVWTAERAQERGIHVHILDKEGNKVVDDTFGEVIFDGAALDRDRLLQMMLANSQTGISAEKNAMV